MPKMIDKYELKTRLDGGLYEQYLTGTLNQRQLAVELGVSVDILSDVFSGRIRSFC